MGKKQRRRGGPTVKRPTEEEALAHITSEWRSNPLAKFWSLSRFLRACRQAVQSVPSISLVKISRYELSTKLWSRIRSPLWLLEGVGDDPSKESN